MSQPAIEIERYARDELDSARKAGSGFPDLLEFLGRLFDLEVRERSAWSATLICEKAEKVELGLKPEGFLLICENEEIRDRILARLLDHRDEWAAIVGPLRYPLRKGYWNDRHASNVWISLAIGTLALAVGALSLGGIHLGEEGTPGSAAGIVVFLASISLWFGIAAAGSLWTRLRWRAGKTPFPGFLELTERELTGVVRERALRGPLCSEIELGDIDKIWFLTVEPRSVGGITRRKIRWKYRFEPFGVLSADQEIAGLRIRAAGRTHFVRTDRLEREDDIRALSTALQQSLRERLFPNPA